MIDIFPNKLDGGPCETAYTERRMTIAAWLDSYTKDGYKDGDHMPISVKVEGEIVDKCDWPTFVFKPSDYVEIRIEPKGTDPFSMAVAIVGAVKAVFGMLMPALPGTPKTPGQGESLIESSVKGNKVKLGGVIRESFGMQKIYPDFLVPPRKYFSGPRTQWTELFMCVGKGSFDILAGNVRIGDTPLIALGAEASYQIFEPGEIVSGNSASNNWHNAVEVGSSTTGAAGLELTFTTDVTPVASAGAFAFSGYTISIPTGQGTFPADWTVGLVLRVVAPYTYTVTDGGGSARDVITGPLGMLNPTVGDTIEVTGNNAGKFTVNSYTGGGSPSMTLNYEWGDPANSMNVGTGLAAIGPDGLRFRISAYSASSITVVRLTSAGTDDVSFPGFDALTTSSGSVAVDALSGSGGWRGPFPACPENELTSLVEFDMFLPEGLTHVGGKGDLNERTVSFEVQYREAGSSGAYTSQSFSYTANTLDQTGFTRTIALPYPMQPEVRMRKTAPAEESIQDHNTIQWYSLRSLLPSPSSYAGVTTLAVKVQSSDRIAAQTESLVWVIGTRILPTRSGGGWTDPIPTRDIIPATAYIAKSIGYTDSDLDLAEMDRLDSVWKSRDDNFDLQITDASTAKDTLNDALGAGFAELALDRGVIRPVRDEPRTTFEHMYTPQNMTEGLTRDVQMPGPDDFDGVDISYIDKDSWVETVIECRLPGDLGRRAEKIKATGVIDRTKAWRLGMRRRRIQRYRRDRYSWSTEMDAMNSRYMSYCMVADDVPGYGQSAMMLDFTIGIGYVSIESSEPLDWSVGATYMAAIRKQDGTVSGPYVATRVDDYNFTIPSLDFAPDVSWEYEPPHILFGPATRYHYAVLVSDVSPSGISKCSVDGVGYNSLVYASDDQTAP